MASLAVVTGANRGIGLELTRQLHARRHEVAAVCRRRSPALDALGVRVEDDCDVTLPEVWSRLAKQFANDDIDLLVDNAGIAVPDGIDSADPAQVRRQFETNALAPLFLTQALLPSMRAGAKIVLITSRMGSMGDNRSGGYYGYRMSKAAMNAAGVSLAHDLRPRGIAVAILHPGAVRTALTGNQGMLDAAEAVRGLLQRIDELTLEQTGRFLHMNGQELPW